MLFTYITIPLLFFVKSFEYNVYPGIFSSFISKVVFVLYLTSAMMMITFGFLLIAFLDFIKQTITLISKSIKLFKIIKQRKLHEKILKLHKKQQALEIEKSLPTSNKDLVELKELILFSEIKELTETLKKS